MSIRRRSVVATIILLAAVLVGAAWYKLRAPVVSRGDIVATVDGNAITARDVEARLIQLLPPVSFHGNLPPDRLLALRRTALDQLILDDLIVRDAIELGTTVDDAVVDGEMQKVRAGFETEAEYAQALKDNHFTEKEFRAMLRRDMIVQRAKATRTPSAPDARAIRAYYDANQEKFVRPERVRLQQIVIAVGTDVEEPARKGEATKLLRRLNNGGDFGALAAEYSKDAHGMKKDGEPVWIHRGRLTPPIEDAAFSAPLNQPQMVRSDSGYHLFVVREREESRQLTLEEATPSIIDRLSRTSADASDRTWRAGLLARARIEISDPELRAAKPFEMSRSATEMPPHQVP